MKKVLLLDIDYTVINTDSMIDFMIYSLKKKTIKTIIMIPYIFIVLVLHAMNIVSLKKAKEAVFSPIINFSTEELKLFFDDCIIKRMNSSMIDIINKSKKDGFYIVMITASPYAYMKYFKDYGFADKVIATELTYKDDKYVNKIIGDNCKGDEKVKRINQFFSEVEIEVDYDNSYAYSDSKSDLPMLSLVKNAFIVNKKNGEIIENLNKNRANVI